MISLERWVPPCGADGAGDAGGEGGGLWAAAARVDVFAQACQADEPLFCWTCAWQRTGQRQ